MTPRALLARALVLGVLAARCKPCPEAGPLAAWHFERPCDDASATCGFVADHGALSIVELHHPAEHGLHFARDTSAHANLSGRAGRPPYFLSFVTRCEPGARITVDLFVDPAPGDAAAPGFPSVAMSPPTGWSSFASGFGNAGAASGLRALQITTVGGACDIDEVQLREATVGCF